MRSKPSFVLVLFSLIVPKVHHQTEPFLVCVRNTHMLQSRRPTQLSNKPTPHTAAPSVLSAPSAVSATSE